MCTVFVFSCCVQITVNFCSVIFKTFNFIFIHTIYNHVLFHSSADHCNSHLLIKYNLREMSGTKYKVCVIFKKFHNWMKITEWSFHVMSCYCFMYYVCRNLHLHWNPLPSRQQYKALKWPWASLDCVDNCTCLLKRPLRLLLQRWIAK